MILVGDFVMMEVCVRPMMSWGDFIIELERVMTSRYDDLAGALFLLDLLRFIPRHQKITAKQLKEQLDELGHQKSLRTIQRQLENLVLSGHSPSSEMSEISLMAMSGRKMPSIWNWRAFLPSRRCYLVWHIKS